MMLDVRPNDRVLEIGTGSGYQAAVLCELGARVLSIERHRPLRDRKRKVLDALGYRAVLRHGDGSLGWPADAPLDGFLVPAAAAQGTRPSLDEPRVREEGRRAAPLGGPVDSPVR